MRSQLKNLFLTSLATLAVLAALEFLARSVSTISQDVATIKSLAATQWLAYSPDVGWEKRPGFKGHVGRAYREFDESGYFNADSAQRTAVTGNKKVIFLGDSNTFGFGAPTAASFVEVADRLLPEVDMINLGVIGYSSYQGRVTFEKYLPLLKPDLVVVSFNINDRRYVTPPGEIDSPEEFQRVYRSTENTVASSIRYLEMSYIFKGLRRIMRNIGLASEPVTEISVTQLKPRVDEKSYRQNLSFIAAEARRLNIPVLFVLLRDNPIQSEHLKQGIASFEKRDYDKAIAYLDSAVISNIMFADLARIYLARTYVAKGDKPQATEAAAIRSIFRSFSGGTLIRRDTDYNEIMRQVAAENNMPLLDGATVLEAHPYVFIDFCHFNAEGHRLLGTQLAERITAILAK